MERQRREDDAKDAKEEKQIGSWWRTGWVAMGTKTLNASGVFRVPFLASFAFCSSP
jgi:hypothetical protein